MLLMYTIHTLLIMLCISSVESLQFGEISVDHHCMYDTTKHKRSAWVDVFQEIIQNLKLNIREFSWL